MVKRKKKVNKNYLIGLGALFIVIIVGLIFGLNQFTGNTTGASVSIEYYGVSDQLRSDDAGKIQTYIELKQPTLRTLSTSAGRAELAETIIQTVSFTEGLVEIYQSDPPAPIPAGALDDVTVAVSAENSNFKTDQPCLFEIGSNHRNRPELKLALITELKYQKCHTEKHWWFAYIKHSFYDLSEGGFICSHDGNKLFSVNEISGEVTTDLTNC